MQWDAESLFRETEWMGRLARRLVPEGAEDLVQDTLVAALEEPRRPSRAWLAAVLRHRSLDRWRSGSARRAREEAVARPEREPDPCQGLALVERQGRLVQAVLALDEPFRTTVVLRYIDELTPAEIAERQECSLGTVHSRLARGLERLRARLRAGCDDEREWLGLVLPLARLAPREVALGGASGLTLGLGAALAPGLVLAIWVAVAALGSFASHDRPHRPALADPVRASDAKSEADVAIAIEDARATETSRSPAGMFDALLEAEEVELGADALGIWLDARVVDPSGAPVEGCALSLVATSEGLPTGPLALPATDASGTSRLRLTMLEAIGSAARADARLRLHARGSDGTRGFATVEGDAGARRLSADLVLEARPAVRLRILDPDGTPAAGASCTLMIDASYDGPGHAQVRQLGADPDGMLFIDCQDAERARAWIVHAGARGHTEPFDLRRPIDLGTLTLRPWQSAEGRLVTSRGEAVPDVPLVWQLVEAAPGSAELVPTRVGDATSGPQVVVGRSWRGRTDAEGGFVADGLAPGRYRVTSPLAGDWSRTAEVPSRGTELVLDAGLLLVQVRDAAGLPEPGVEVVLQVDAGDGTFLEWNEAEARGTRAVAAFEIDWPSAASRVRLFVPRPRGSLRPFEVELDDVRGIQQVVLPTGSGDERGELWLALRAPAGVVSPPARAQLLTLDGAWPVTESLAVPADGRLAGLPIGRYRLRLELAADVALRERLYLVAPEREVEVVAADSGAATEVGARGELRATVGLDSSSATRARRRPIVGEGATAELDSAPPGSCVENALGFEIALGARVFLSVLDASPLAGAEPSASGVADEPRRIRVDWRPSEASGRPATDVLQRRASLAAGEAGGWEVPARGWVDHVFAPGEGELVLHGYGWRATRRGLALEPGADVELDVQPVLAER